LQSTGADGLGARGKVEAVLDALRARYGRPERRESDPLEVLVRGVLSQNTSDVNSGRAYENLRSAFGTWEALARATVGAIAEAIQPGGLAAQKARTIKALMDALARRGAYSLEHLRGLSATEAERELSSVKGVGRKTARLVLLFGFGMPVFVVDTHVHRVTGRLGLIPPRCSRDRAHVLLDALVPDARKYEAHINLIRHGRQTCAARRPACESCVLRGWCAFGA